MVNSSENIEVPNLFLASRHGVNVSGKTKVIEGKCGIECHC